MKEVTPIVPSSIPPKAPEKKPGPFYKKPWFWIIVAAVAVLVILLVVFLKGGKKAEDTKKEIKKPKNVASYAWKNEKKDGKNGEDNVETGSLRNNFDDIPDPEDENTLIQINGVYGGKDRGPATVNNGNAEVKPGNVFQYGDLQIGFIDADLDYKNYIDSNDSFKKPEDKYVVVAVGLRNTGSSGTIKVDSDEFACMADYEPCFDAAEEKFDSVELAPGQSKTIYLIYIVPKNSKVIRIQYTPHYYKASGDAEIITFYVLDNQE